MTLRLRQVALVARDISTVVEQLEAVLDAQVMFRDPAVGAFGLQNALLTIGDQFLEVVSPITSDTTAGRLLERRGDSGYMVLLQTDDLSRDRSRVESAGVRVVWDIAIDDIAAVHLHPRDVGGAIVSLDQPVPPSSWRWGGPDWETRVAKNARRLTGITIEAGNAESVARRWSEIFALTTMEVRNGERRTEVSDAEIRFVEAGPRGDGLLGVRVAMREPGTAVGRANALGLPIKDGVVTICGTAFELVEDGAA